MCEFLSSKEKVKHFEENFIEKYRSKNLSASVWNDSEIFDQMYRRKLTKKWALFNSFQENPEFNTPYFKMTEFDKLNTEAYVLKLLK